MKDLIVKDERGFKLPAKIKSKVKNEKGNRFRKEAVG